MSKEPLSTYQTQHAVCLGCQTGDPSLPLTCPFAGPGKLHSYLAWATEALQKTAEHGCQTNCPLQTPHHGGTPPRVPPYKSWSLCKCRGSRTNLQSTQSPVTDRGCMSSEHNSKGKIKGISNLLSRFREKKEKKITCSCKSKVTSLSQWTDVPVFSHERATQGRLSSGKVSEGETLSFHNLSRAQRGHPPQGLCWLSEPTGKVSMPCLNGRTASGAQTRHQESESRRKQPGHTPVTLGKATIIAPSPGTPTLCSAGRPCLHSLYYSAAGVGIFRCKYLYSVRELLLACHHKQIYKKSAKMWHKQIC